MSGFPSFALTVTVAVAVEFAIAVPFSAVISCEEKTTLYTVSFETSGAVKVYVAIPEVALFVFEKANNVPFAVPPVTLLNVNPLFDDIFIAPDATGS